MAETKALSRESGAELVVVTHADNLLDDAAVLRDTTAVLHRALPYDLSSDRMLRRTHIKGQEVWA